MKIYVGDVIRNAVNHKDQPLPKNRLANMLGLSRTQFYRVLNDPEMDVDYVMKFGKALNRDFNKEFPEVKEHDWVFEEPQKEYSMGALKEEMFELQRKYIRALEDIIQLRKDLRNCEGKLVQA